MNSQKYNKEEQLPKDFTEDDKLEFDILLEQAKIIFPKLSNDVWLLKMGIIDYIQRLKKGEDRQATEEEIANIKNKYTQDSVFYTEPFDYQSSNIEITSNISIDDN